MQLSGVGLGQLGGAAQAIGLVVALAATFLTELFLVPYLAAALTDPGAPASAAWRITLSYLRPGVRAVLLEVAYAVAALLVGLLLFGPRDTAAPSDAVVTRLYIGLAPLVAFALAFLAVLRQRVLLGHERRVLLAAAGSHRVAGAQFPICLLVGLLGATDLVASAIATARLAVLLPLALALSVLNPFATAVGNGLYQRTRDLTPARPRAAGR